MTNTSGISLSNINIEWLISFIPVLPFVAVWYKQNNCLGNLLFIKVLCPGSPVTTLFLGQAATLSRHRVFEPVPSPNSFCDCSQLLWGLNILPQTTPVTLSPSFSSTAFADLGRRINSLRTSSF